MEKDNITMKDMPVSEQPYEKCEHYGAQSLSDSELLAAILRTGSRGECSTDLAKRLLLHLPNKNISGLFQSSLEQLREIKGIGKVKAVQLLCLTEIAKRMLKNQQVQGELLCDEPRKIAACYIPLMSFLEKEQVRLLILNGRNVMVSEVELSNGSFASAVAAPREVFYYALKHRAVSIILLHNHPSGDPTPSKEDLTLTRRIANTGDLVGIPLLDHIVIGASCYVSFRESGYFSSIN